jgi:hypothetical protein
MSLDDDGLRRGGELVAAASEDSIYKALGMQPVLQSSARAAMRRAGLLPEHCRSL